MEMWSREVLRFVMNRGAPITQDLKSSIQHYTTVRNVCRLMKRCEALGAGGRYEEEGERQKAILGWVCSSGAELLRMGLGFIHFL